MNGQALLPDGIESFFLAENADLSFFDGDGQFFFNAALPDGIDQPGAFGNGHVDHDLTIRFSITDLNGYRLSG